MNRLLALAFLAFSCQSESQQSPGIQTDLAAPPPLGDPLHVSRSYVPEPKVSTVRFVPTEEEPNPRDAVRIPDEKKVIWNADLEIQVPELPGFQSRFTKTLRDFGAYMVSSELTREYEEVSYQSTIRVPSTQLDSLVATLRNQSTYIRRFSKNSQDVTEEYFDSRARLQTKKALEARYLDILKQAKRVEDVLEVEEKLETVRGEIESLEGKLRYFDNQTTFSTLNLTAYTVEKVETEPGLSLGSRLASALETGWQGFLSMLVTAVEVWYKFLLILLVLLAIRIWWKRRNRPGKPR